MTLSTSFHEKANTLWKDTFGNLQKYFLFNACYLLKERFDRNCFLFPVKHISSLFAHFKWRLISLMQREWVFLKCFCVLSIIKDIIFDTKSTLTLHKNSGLNVNFLSESTFEFPLVWTVWTIKRIFIDHFRWYYWHALTLQHFKHLSINGELCKM